MFYDFLSRSALSPESLCFACPASLCFARPPSPRKIPLTKHNAIQIWDVAVTHETVYIRVHLQAPRGSRRGSRICAHFRADRASTRRVCIFALEANAPPPASSPATLRCAPTGVMVIAISRWKKSSGVKSCTHRKIWIAQSQIEW